MSLVDGRVKDGAGHSLKAESGCRGQFAGEAQGGKITALVSKGICQSHLIVQQHDLIAAVFERKLAGCKI